MRDIVGNNSALVRDLAERPDTVDYAVGDVHGYLDNLVAALRWCAADAAARGMRARVHLLGDYVDRGPDSRGVVELLMRGWDDPHVELLPLRGNHDHVFASVVADPRHELAREWWEHGGQQTLMSYGWDPVRDGLPGDIRRWVSDGHARFLGSLPLACTVGQRLFVHAGVRPGRALARQTGRDLMWIRTEFLKYQGDYGHVVVHGHSPESANPRDHGNRIAMDGGCFYTGNLAVAAFDPGACAPRFMIAKSVMFEPTPPRIAGPLPAP